MTRICLLVVALLCLACLDASPAQALTQDLYARLERAAELIRQNQLGRAEAELETALRARPRDTNAEANALNLLGVIRAQQKRHEEAERLFLRAVEQSPALVSAFVNLGQLYLDDRKSERAFWAFAEAAKLAPDHPEINYQLASLYAERGDFAPALERLEKIPRQLLNPEHLYLFVKSYLGLGRSDEAIALAAPLKQPGVAPPETVAAFAALFAANNQTGFAIQILEAALAREPNSYALLYNLGSAHFQKKDLVRAAEFYQKSLVSKPDDVAALRALARVWRARGDLRQSFTYISRATKLAPDAPDLLYDFAWTALNLDLFSDALPALERLHRNYPAVPSYLYTLAVAHFYNNDDERAQALLNRYVELYPKDARGHYVLGVVLYSAMKFAPARASLERSFALNPTADAAYYLGMIADAENNLPLAEQWFRRATATDASHAPSHAQLGINLAKQKNYAAARTSLERAVELDPQDLTAAYQLGMVYMRLGEKGRAQTMFAAADRLRSEQRHAPRTSLRLADPPQ